MRSLRVSALITADWPWRLTARRTSKSRTELVVFLTPRVIYDANQMVEASDEIKAGMRRIQNMTKDQ